MLATLTLRQPSDAPGIARLILQGHPGSRVFALHGELGAGKTTLIKGFCTALGVTDQASSPSFAIVNEYRAASGEPVFHFDLYRLKDAAELEGIGFTEYVDSGHYCFIEWPELAADLLPPGTLHLSLEAALSGARTIAISTGG
ncbi:MAG: tRNA (adenosine(37)-N6)-threonylcarbamoyltransferase complex ATPase subunit type 1 TsaE [Flavobacteriales bacterium]|nr:MAG: tRNA (adenosine(37)-N6)-threonylcarbamoyltransferase complex ATPase subunit type 1 TsaE [Flavobacteriales bacterium]